MKLAILLLVHKNPAAIKKIVDKLQHRNIFFYVHVDKKIGISRFKSVLSDNERVIFLESNRVFVNWGGRSQVDAMLNLLKTSYSSKDSYDHFLFISGTDYPINSPETLLKYLAKKNREIIRVDRKILESNDDKITNLNIHDISFLNHRNHKFILGTILLYLTKALRLIKIRKFPHKLEFVHGSSWICLTKNGLNHIFNFCKKNPDYYDIFKYSFSSDEIFFHTILYNSGLKLDQNYLNEPLNNCNRYGLHYIDWSLDIPNPPKEIKTIDLNKISKEKNIFFVRKVNFNDSVLLNKLDKI